MLTSLLIRNFRGLQDLHVPEVGRVNLIVGKNNSGKSTILEALRIYANMASTTLLDSLVLDHDETLKTQETLSTSEYIDSPYQHFFTGREFPLDDNLGIYIGDKAESLYVKINHIYYREETLPDGEDGIGYRRRIPVPKKEVEGAEDLGQALLISSNRREQPKLLTISNSIGTFRSPTSDPSSIPLGFVPTKIMPSGDLADLWDSVALTGYDEVVREGLKIIEESVEGIAFVKRVGSRGRASSERTAIVKLRNINRPIALSSMGDGMMRVLQLLLVLVPAREGLYLVDEFENGLHFSVQEKVWEMIFKLAKSSNIQVFAATHSWDCIEAFKNVAAKYEESAVLFRVGRSVKVSDKGKTIAPIFNKASLANLTQMDVEVR